MTTLTHIDHRFGVTYRVHLDHNIVVGIEVFHEGSGTPFETLSRVSDLPPSPRAAIEQLLCQRSQHQS